FSTPLGLPELDTSEWYLQLIRYEYPLGEDYEPPALTEIEDGEYMDSRVANALIDMIAAARASGYPVYVCSCYRPYSTQYIIYWDHVDEYMAQGMTQEEAEAATRLAVNYPGASEHQSGLAADILESADQDMEPYIGGSGLMLWLEENCAAFGYVIRYPDGKTDITGVEYEPWHLRYVGTEAAMYMMENDLCLEEFLELLEQYQ
ncbi:MAG: M15 family metallopeptidase, partial [Oscillospiraceae bacterium]|nr:M15 family metallopeptidase [Oscillospiraceae bacterium]